MEKLGIIGVHITSQNLRLLEKLTLPQQVRASKLKEVKEFCGIAELVYVATCNRVEFIFITPDGSDISLIRNRLLDYFFSGDNRIAFDPNDFKVLSGADAATHLFSVASAIDSLVIGEAQILGQLKEAFAFAEDNELVGPLLTKFFGRAFHVAKKVRSQTDLGKKSVSMVSLTTKLIDQVVQSEPNASIALIGVGEMTRKLATYLKKKGIRDILFVNRTVEKTKDFVAAFGGRALSLADFLENAPRVRIICSATSSPVPIFTDMTVAPMLNCTNRLLLIDLAVPRDVAVDNDRGGRLAVFNISDLREMSEENRRQRFRDVDAARTIIAEELVRFHKGMIEQDLRPIFNHALEHSREFADKGLEKLFATVLPHLNDNDRDAIIHWVNKLVPYVSNLPAKEMAEHFVTVRNTPSEFNHDSQQKTPRSRSEKVSERP